MATKTRYIPAMHYHWLTPFYDALSRLTLPDLELKGRLLRQARIPPGAGVLDVGCGTGTLALLIKRMHPDANVTGLDVDARILQIARRKTLQSSADIALHRGTAQQLPYADNSFDRALSSFVLHHLTREDKQRTAAEIFRVLRPGGELHTLDFGKPHNLYGRLVACLSRRAEELADNVQGLLPDMFRAAGFVAVAEQARVTTLFGTVSLYRARKPQ